MEFESYDTDWDSEAYLTVAGQNSNNTIRVTDEFKKKGVGERIINHLIEEAKKLKISKLSIETGAGEFFLPARKLFSKFGFKKCPPFAHYKEDPNSCYYTLNL